MGYIDVDDESKCVGDNFQMLVTVSAILVTNIQKLSPTLSHQHYEVTNINDTIQKILN